MKNLLFCFLFLNGFIHAQIGGTEFSHKFNLKDPRDLDAAYRLTFSGGMTHSSSGIVPNGINAYADTKLTPSIISSAYIGYYSSSNTKSVGSDQIDMGSITPSSGQIFISSWTDGSALGVKGAVARYSASGMLLYSNTVTDLRGFFSMNRVSGTIKFYQNTSLITSQFTGSSVLPNINLYLCALNNNGNTQMFSNRTMSMSIISDSLTETDVTNLYNTVQQFQTDLGRQV